MDNLQIKYNEFIILKCKELTNSYKKEFQTGLTHNQIIDIDNNFVFLFKTLSDKIEDSTTEYDLKNYLPAIEPVINYSYIYEFESLYFDVIDNGLIEDHVKEGLSVAYNIWYTLLDTWFDYKYGYFFDELEKEMQTNKMGVFARLDYA